MKLILACDPSGGIGYKNKLPWTNLRGDLFRFRQLTTGQTIVMGRNTWESLPKKPLPNRTNIVVTSRPIPDTVCLRQVADLANYPSAWLIGGASLVNSAWDLVDSVHLSLTHNHYTCDTFIDLVKLQQDFVMEYSEQCADHDYQIWKRTI